MQSVSIIGVGRVGGALAIALSSAGYQIVNLFTRNPSNAQNVVDRLSVEPTISTAQDFNKIAEDIVFITTQDQYITEIAQGISKTKLENKSIVFHTSGSLSSEVLDSLREKGLKVGSIHPLVSISDSFFGVERLKNAYFCVEGDKEAVVLAHKLVADLGGHSFSVETKYKMLYHASAVTASGHLVALFETAIKMLSSVGLKSEEAKRILLPLVESTVDNLKTQANAESLTGPFARADIKTLESHIEVLKGNTLPDYLSLYLQLGKESIKLARQQGADESRLQTMKKMIDLAESELKYKSA